MVVNADQLSNVSRIAYDHLVSRNIRPGAFISEEMQPESIAPSGNKSPAAWVVKFMYDPPDEIFVFHIVVVDPETMEASIVPRM